MPYATVDALKLKFGEDIDQLLDRDGDGTADDGLADRVLVDASTEVDTILAARYPVPVTGAVPYLVSVCCDVARYHLYDDVVPETVQKRYDDAIKQLREIVKGNGELVLGSGSTVPDKYATGQSGGGVTIEAPRPRIFTDSSLKGFME